VAFIKAGKKLDRGSSDTGGECELVKDRGFLGGRNTKESGQEEISEENPGGG